MKNSVVHSIVPSLRDSVLVSRLPRTSSWAITCRASGTWISLWTDTNTQQELNASVLC